MPPIPDTVWATLSEVVPYAVIYLLIVMVVLAADARRETLRTKNAAALETRREEHEKEMQKKQLQHERDMNNMWALQFKEVAENQRDMLKEQIRSNKSVIEALEAHEEASADRYERSENTKDLIRAAAKLGTKAVRRNRSGT